jgi:hypothetical protein
MRWVGIADRKVHLDRISHQPRLPCIRGAKRGAIVVYAPCLRNAAEHGEIGWPLVNIGLISVKDRMNTIR